MSDNKKETSKQLQVNNEPQKVKFSQLISCEKWQATILQTLQDPKLVKAFTSSLITLVSNNPALQACEPSSILVSAFKGIVLGLNPNLEQYYLIPYKDKDTGKINANFQLGYKGWYQLAMRSGKYKKIIVCEVKKGELISCNMFEEDLIFKQIQDETTREKAETIGYYAMFEKKDGFVKKIYWTKTAMQKFALRYSQSYKKDRGTNLWKNDFDTMAHKTILKQLISKWGDMTQELSEAYEAEIETETNINNSEDITDITDIEPEIIPAEINFEELGYVGNESNI